MGVKRVVLYHEIVDICSMRWLTVWEKSLIFQSLIWRRRDALGYYILPFQGKFL